MVLGALQNTIIQSTLGQRPSAPGVFGMGNALGAAGLIGGTLLNMNADKRRTDALNRAQGQRASDVGGFDQRRDQILAGQQQNTLSGGAQSDQNTMALLQGLVGQQGAFDQGQSQGLQDIQSGRDFIQQQAPAGGGFGLNSIGAQQAGANQQLQAAPQNQAALALQGSDLGRLEQGRQAQELQQQTQLRGAELRNILGIGQQQAQIGQGQVGIDDLKSNLQFQNAAQAASQVGGRTQAFGGLLQSLGGGLLGG